VRTKPVVHACHTDRVPEFVVAGALVEHRGHLLLVLNRRRGGFTDWSTPGGVIDATDASLIAGLTREVEEETGLRVTSWEGPLYEVRTSAPDLGWQMRAEVHRALTFEGELAVADPDGIVIDAMFVEPAELATRLEQCHPWVAEPIVEWLEGRWGPDDARTYHYEVRGTARESWSTARLRVVRGS